MQIPARLDPCSVPDSVPLTPVRLRLSAVSSLNHRKVAYCTGCVLNRNPGISPDQNVNTCVTVFLVHCRLPCALQPAHSRTTQCVMDTHLQTCKNDHHQISNALSAPDIRQHPSLDRSSQFHLTLIQGNPRSLSHGGHLLLTARSGLVAAFCRN